jgi:uncharacterized membrane protein
VELARVVFRWIHILAASLWLGSFVFIIAVMRAPVQELGRHTALDPMLVRFRRRYKSLLIATVMALAVSGIVTLALRPGPVDVLYVILLVVKVLLSVGVIALFWYVAFVREEPRRRIAPEPSGAFDQPSAESHDTAGPAEQQQQDVDFFFRPKRQHALVQWWIVAGTVAVIFLGMTVARRGAHLALPEKAPPPAAQPAE